MLCKHATNGSCCYRVELFTIISTVPSYLPRFKAQRLFCKRCSRFCFQPEISAAAEHVLMTSAGLRTNHLSHTHGRCPGHPCHSGVRVPKPRRCPRICKGHGSLSIAQQQSWCPLPPPQGSHMDHILSLTSGIIQATKAMK